MGEPPDNGPSKIEGETFASVSTTTAPPELDVTALANALLEFAGQSHSADSQQVLGRFLQQIGDALHTSCASLCLLSAEQTHAELILVYGPPTPASHLGSTPPFHEFGEPWPGVRATEGPPPDILAHVCRQHAPVVGVAGADGIPQVASDWGEVGSCAGVVVPGPAGPRGAIFLGRAPDAPSFSRAEEALVASIASVISLYMQVAHLQRETEQQTQRESSLAMVAAACIEASDQLPYALARQTVADILKADALQIWVLSDGGSTLR